MSGNFRKRLLIALTIVICTITNALAYDPIKLYDDVWSLIENKYVDRKVNAQNWQKWRHKYDRKIKTDDDAYVAIRTMLASLNDPYTRFLAPDEFKEENNSIKGTLRGIGVQIGIKNDKLTVIAPIEDTPAEKAGLQANDLIIEINGKSTNGITVKEAADQIRGPEGTSVNLKIKRDKKEFVRSIVRAKIVLKSVSIKPPKEAKLKNNIGYIRLSTFINKSAAREIMNAVKQLEDKEGYILDLRSNPGGLLTNAIIISDMFLPGGKIVSTVDRDGYMDTQEASDHYLTNKPLVVLINGGSASASEIVSGALRDNERAVLIGTKSFGKGLVQEINRLPGGSGINITTQKYLTPNGTFIHKKGIVPDVKVEITEADIKKKVDPQLKKANEVLQGLIKNHMKESAFLQGMFKSMR